ncbi:MAG TPA: oxidoreductase [Gryllotalpicola sp.]
MITRLDGLLGRATMYRLVLIVLGVIWAAAVLFGALHLIAFTPLALVLSAAVALVVGYLSNRLLALIWRVRPHSESSLVTAMLLVFLFLPLPTVQAQGALAFAVAAANLSKYLLAWRGRHVFNPVAVGAVVVMLTRLSGATWWVATPALLPFVVIGGMLVLHRASAWSLALPVVVIGIVGTTIHLAALGSTFGSAAWTAVASFPYLFFGAFMVSEPLTAPPRRWQRLAISALIGAISLVPAHIGYIAMAPEIALVIGNAVAFGFGPRGRVRLTLAARRSLLGGIDELVFRPERPLRIRAGQFLELSLPHTRQDGRGARRVFSIASAPEADAVRIITRHEETLSSFKRALLALESGAVVPASTVGGDFTVGAETRPQLWLTSGVGVTPFLSAADAHARAGRSTDAVLLWAVRDGDDLGWAPALDAAGVRVLVVGPTSLSEPGRLPDGWSYAGERLTADLLRRHVPDAARRAVWAAGSPRIVAAARAAAHGNGVRRIRTDRFIGY